MALGAGLLAARRAGRHRARDAGCRAGWSGSRAAGVTALVDYAHTDDALRARSSRSRSLTRGRLIVVFGCGGDRDKGKRPLMGEAAAEGADLAVVTSRQPAHRGSGRHHRGDHPRPREGRPAADLGGRRRSRARRATWSRRTGAAAIELAVCLAKPGDVVLIAGKGHEDYQIVGEREAAASTTARRSRRCALEAGRAVATRLSMAVRFSDEQVVKRDRRRAGSAAARAPRYDAVCTDTRALTPGCLFVALAGESFDAHDVPRRRRRRAARPARWCRRAARCRRCPRTSRSSRSTTRSPRWAALARFHRRRFEIPVGAVTGSNGKTTTKEMVGGDPRDPRAGAEDRGQPQQRGRRPADAVPARAVARRGGDRDGHEPPGRDRPAHRDRRSPTPALITVVQPGAPRGAGLARGRGRGQGRAVPRPAAGRDRGGRTSTTPLIVAQAEGERRRRRSAFGRAANAEVRLVARRAARAATGSTVAHRRGRRGARVSGSPSSASTTRINATAAFAMARGARLLRPRSACRASRRRARTRGGSTWLDAPGGFAVIDDCYNANPALDGGGARDACSGLARAAGARSRCSATCSSSGPARPRSTAQLGEQAARGARRWSRSSGRARDRPQAAKAAGLGAAHFTEIEPLVAWLRPQLRQETWCW